MGIGFSGPLIIEEVGYERWKVVEDFRFTSATGLVVDVHAGFCCDLASVPAIAQGIVSKLGYWTQPAVCHDLLYHRHRMGLDTTLTRMEADRVLLEGCRLKAAEYHVPAVERRGWLIFGAVVAGAEFSWYTPEERKAVMAHNALSTDILDQ